MTVKLADVREGAAGRPRRWPRRIAQIALYAVLALALLLLTLLVLVPRVTGWVPLTVLSGSMEPALPVGSQVIVQPLSEEDLAEIGTGDVIAFMPRPDDPTLVTHRVVTQSVRSDGSIQFITRGDANTADDAEPVLGAQVRATVRYHVPYAGYLTSWLSPRQKHAATVAVGVSLLGYAGWQSLVLLRQRHARTNAADQEQQP